MALSERERRFVEAYMGPAAGNGTEACRLAGYKGNGNVLHVQANRLLRKATVRGAIEERTENDPVVATREQRQALWSDISFGRGAYADAALRDRLKASELLGKSQADFVDRQLHEGTVTVEHRGAAERLAGNLASIATRAARRVSGGSQ